MNTPKVKAIKTAPTKGAQHSNAVAEVGIEEKRVRKIVKSALRGTENRAKFSAAINQFLSGLTLPRDYLMPRLPNGSDPTALANPWSRYDAAFAGSPVAGPLNTNECVGFVFRDALRYFVSTVGLAAQSVYTGVFGVNVAGPVEAFPTFWGTGGGLPCVSPDKPHGDYIYPGRVGPADQHRGWLMNNGDSLQVILNTGLYPVGQTVYCMIKQVSNGIWQDYVLTSFAGGTGIVTNTTVIPTTGYYAITFAYTANVIIQNSGTLNLYVGGAGATVFGQKALPNFSTNFSFVDAIRISSVSLMYTNTASPLNRQGQIVGIQVPKGSSWTQWTSFGTLVADKKSKILDALNGMYGFLKPTSADDFNLQVYELPDFQLNTAAGSEMVFDLYPKSDFLALVAQVNIAAGQTGYWTLGAAVEFTTQNQWIELHCADLSHEEMQMALDFLVNVPQWHTNALHWDDIWESIKGAARDTWSAVKEIAPIALAAAPLLL